MMTTINLIQSLTADGRYSYYGLRKDNRRYDVGEIVAKSHQLWQDPQWDDNDELVYPYIEDGVYAGYYDGGELPGTCTIRINDYDDAATISSRIADMTAYDAEYLYLLGGNHAEAGNDINESIICNAVVVAILAI